VQSPDDALRAVAQRHPALDLLVLHGSRARGEEHAGSDWDFAYLARGEIDPLGLQADLEAVLGSSKLDVVDLSRAGGLLRFRAARDGRCLYEAAPGVFDDFRLRAIGFWLDVAPIVEPEYRAVLRSLGRAGDR